MSGSKADICGAIDDVRFTPIATAKADIRTRSCLLCPRKRTCAVQLAMSAKAQKRTFQQIDSHQKTPGHCPGFSAAILHALVREGGELEVETRPHRVNVSISAADSFWHDKARGNSLIAIPDVETSEVIFDASGDVR